MSDISEKMIMNNDNKKHRFFQRITEGIKKYCPKFSLVFFCVCIVAVLVHVTCLISCNFADFYNQTIGCAVRALLAYITMFLPFSLA